MVKSLPDLPPALEQLSYFNKHTFRNKILINYHTKYKQATWE